MWKTKDKFIRGISSGIVAGSLKDIPTLISTYLIKHPSPTFWDYMGLLALGKIPKTWDEYILAIVVEVLWCTVLAVIFVYLRPKLKSNHYILQGAGYGIFIWLMVRAAVYFLRVPELIQNHTLTAMLNCSISIFYGVTLAIVDHKLDVLEQKSLECA